MYVGSFQKLDMSSCQNVSHVGLSSLTSCAGCLRQLVLSYGSPVRVKGLEHLSVVLRF